jgi:hypothetical protein
MKDIIYAREKPQYPDSMLLSVNAPLATGPGATILNRRMGPIKVSAQSPSQFFLNQKEEDGNGSDDDGYGDDEAGQSPEKKQHEDARSFSASAPSQLLSAPKSVEDINTDEAIRVVLGGASFFMFNCLGQKQTIGVSVGADGRCSWGSNKKGAAPLYLQQAIEIKTSRLLQADERACFSIVWRLSRLDLVAQSEKQRNVWLKGLRALQASLRRQAQDKAASKRKVVADSAPRPQVQHDAVLLDLINQGATVLKYRLNGPPRMRLLSYEPETESISWGKVRRKSISLLEVSAIVGGNQTPGLRHAQAVPSVLFSIIHPARTLDFEANTERVSGFPWLHYLHDRKIYILCVSVFVFLVDFVGCSYFLFLVLFLFDFCLILFVCLFVGVVVGFRLQCTRETLLRIIFCISFAGERHLGSWTSNAACQGNVLQILEEGIWVCLRWALLRVHMVRNGNAMPLPILAL